MIVLNVVGAMMNIKVQLRVDVRIFVGNNGVKENWKVIKYE